MRPHLAWRTTASRGNGAVRVTRPPSRTTARSRPRRARLRRRVAPCKDGVSPPFKSPAGTHHGRAVAPPLTGGGDRAAAPVGTRTVPSAIAPHGETPPWPPASRQLIGAGVARQPGAAASVTVHLSDDGGRALARTTLHGAPPYKSCHAVAARGLRVAEGGVVAFFRSFFLFFGSLQLHPPPGPFPGHHPPPLYSLLSQVRGPSVANDDVDGRLRRDLCWSFSTSGIYINIQDEGLESVK